MSDYEQDDGHACARCGDNMTWTEWLDGPVCSDCKDEDRWYERLAEETEECR